MTCIIYFVHCNKFYYGCFFYLLLTRMKYNRIKVVLAEKDVSVQQLADKMGRSRPVVSNYVNNYTQPSFSYYSKLQMSFVPLRVARRGL